MCYGCDFPQRPQSPPDLSECARKEPPQATSYVLDPTSHNQLASTNGLPESASDDGPGPTLDLLDPISGDLLDSAIDLRDSTNEQPADQVVTHKN